MEAPLVFSPKRHRYHLALSKLSAPVHSIADIGGYRSRPGIVTQYGISAGYTAVNPSTAWYGPEEIDVQCSGENVPLPDNSYDAVISVDTLEHIERKGRRQVISEMCRLSRNFVVVVVPFQGSSLEMEEEILLKVTRSGGIRDMPSLLEHTQFGLPELDELVEYADQFDLSIEPATPRRLYWAGQLAMAINHVSLGNGALDVNEKVLIWQEKFLQTSPSPVDFSDAYRAVMYKGGATE